MRLKSLRFLVLANVVIYIIVISFIASLQSTSTEPLLPTLAVPQNDDLAKLASDSNIEPPDDDSISITNPTILSQEEATDAPPPLVPTAVAVDENDEPSSVTILSQTSESNNPSPTLEVAPDINNEIPQQVVLKFKPEISLAQQNDYIADLNGTILERIDALHMVVIHVPDGMTASNIAASPLLSATEPNFYVYTMQDNTVYSDPYYTEQWALPIIGVSQAWELLDASVTDMTVAVIDSGVKLDHPDLQGRISAGWDFIQNDNSADDEMGHGTAVAGIIAANSNNQIGIAGIAPHVNIMPLKVLDANGYGSYSDVAQGIIYAADNNVPIINLSLGGIYPSTLLLDAVTYAESRGSIVIAAAGNTSSTQIMYPAAYPSVVSVGSIDKTLQHSAFSSTGASIDLYAPGSQIMTTSKDNSYSFYSGTSFAAPHVSAIAALELALGGTLNQDGNILHFSGAVTPPTPVVTPLPPLPDIVIAPEVSAELARTGSADVIINLKLPANAQANDNIRSQAILSAQDAVLSTLSANDFTLAHQFGDISALAGSLKTSGVRALETSEQVLSVHLDTPIYPTGTNPADAIQADIIYSSSEFGSTGDGVTIAVLDTGIDTDHPDFTGKIIGQLCTAYGQCLNPISAEDDNGHGTNVASIIAGESGIAKDAQLFPIRVLGEYGRTSDWIAALDWIKLHPTVQVDIINLSFGTQDIVDGACDAAFARVFPGGLQIINQLVEQRGIVMISASGNQGNWVKNEKGEPVRRFGVNAPACLSNVISVGATYTSDTNPLDVPETYADLGGDWPDCTDTELSTSDMTCFTNVGSNLNILAPGFLIEGAYIDGGFGSYTGTSQAAPVVAGFVALLKQNNPNLSPNTVVGLLQDNATSYASRDGYDIPVLDSLNTIAALANSFCNDVSEIPNSECEVLVSLYNNTNGASWTNNNWLDSLTPCQWTGITCDGGHVTELNLSNSNISGQLPSTIKGLQSLEVLDLSNNQITGLSPALSKLHALQVLDLSNNPLNAVIPPEYGDLDLLEVLDLHNTGVTGQIPPQLATLCNLEVLDLSVSNLTGTIPSAFSNLTQLKAINLSHNTLMGAIPTLGSADAPCDTTFELESLLLNDNDFSGEIPSSVVNLSNLGAVRLDNNNFTGVIPTSIGQLQNLQILNLSNNPLEGEIPTDLGQATQLQALSLSNIGLTGNIPDSFGDLQQLRILHLNQNYLEGQLPEGMINFTLLGESLNVPFDLQQVTPDNLAALDLDYNLFTASNTLAAFLNTFDANWEATQTVPPELEVITKSVNAINLEIHPIAYSNGGGRYIITIRTDNNEVAQFETSSKSGSNLAITGVSPDTTYYIKAQTISDPIGNLTLPMVSKSSDEVVTTTLSLSFCDNVIEIPESECSALESLYYSMDGDNWTNNTGWYESFELPTTDAVTLSLSDISFSEEPTQTTSQPYESPQLIAQNVITVTTTALNRTPDLQCSILEAIDNANNDNGVHTDCGAGSGVDTIILPTNGIYDITTADSAVDGQNGMPSITSPIIIEGNGSQLNRNAIAGNMRIFHVAQTGNLTIRNLTVSNGSVSLDIFADDILASQNGGGIFSRGIVTIENSTISGNTATAVGGGIHSDDGTLTITSSNIIDNQAFAAGGISNINYGNAGVMNIVDSTFSGNTADVDAGALFTEGGEVIISNSTFSNNSAVDKGGAIYLYTANEFSPRVTVNDGSLFDQNSATDGGAFYLETSDSTVFFNDSTASNNTSTASGGAFFNLGDLNIIRSNVIDNQTDTSGGAVLNANSLSVAASTFTGNSVTNVTTGTGGAIASTFGVNFIAGSVFENNVSANTAGALSFTDATVTINRSQFYGNHANTEGGAARITQTSTLDPFQFAIRESTFNGNYVDTAANADVIYLSVTNEHPFLISQSTFSGNGINATGRTISIDKGTVNVVNTTLANNTGIGLYISDVSPTLDAIANLSYVTISENAVGLNTLLTTVGGNGVFVKDSIMSENTNNCLGNMATLNPVGTNFTTDGTCTGFTQVTAGELGLQPLADNGGRVATMALGASSVARDIEDTSSCTTIGDGSAILDARSFPKPAGRNGCDAGAVEMEPTPCNWYGVTCSEGNVTSIVLVDNNLNGLLPPTIDGLPQLTRLWLSNNPSIYGSIPVELSNLTSLEILRLDNLGLNGTIPAELGNLSNLTTLSLRNNNLSGVVPDTVSNMSCLTQLDLAFNDLSEDFSDVVAKLNTCLEILYLGNNQFTGEIPESFGDLSSLYIIDLESNSLSGQLPDIWADFNLIDGEPSGVPTLRLNSNNFQGELPPSIGTLLSDSITQTFDDFYINFAYNALTVADDDPNQAKLFAQLGWQLAAQAVAPENVMVSNAPPNLAAGLQPGTLWVTWDPTVRQLEGGYYRIIIWDADAIYREVFTNDLTTSQLELTGLEHDVEYRVEVETIIPRPMTRYEPFPLLSLPPVEDFASTSSGFIEYPLEDPDHSYVSFPPYSIEVPSVVSYSSAAPLPLWLITYSESGGNYFPQGSVDDDCNPLPLGATTNWTAPTYFGVDAEQGEFVLMFVETTPAVNTIFTDWMRQGCLNFKAGIEPAFPGFGTLPTGIKTLDTRVIVTDPSGSNDLHSLPSDPAFGTSINSLEPIDSDPDVVPGDIPESATDHINLVQCASRVSGDFARSFRSGDFARSFRNGRVDAQLTVLTDSIAPVLVVYEAILDGNGFLLDLGNQIACRESAVVDPANPMSITVTFESDKDYVIYVYSNENTIGEFTLLFDLLVDDYPVIDELPFSENDVITPDPTILPAICDASVTNPQGDFARSFRSGDFARSFRNGELEAELIVETTAFQPIIIVYEDPTDDPADWIPIGCFTAPTVGDFSVPITLQEDTNYIFVVAGNNGTTGDFTFLIAVDNILSVTDLPFVEDGTILDPISIPNACDSILVDPQGDFARSFRNGDFARSFRSGDFARSFRNGELEAELIVETTQIQPIIVIYEDPTGDPVDWIPIGCFTAPSIGDLVVPIILNEDTDYVFVVAGNSGTTGGFTFLIAVDGIPVVTELPFSEDGTIINPISIENACATILTNPQGDFARSFRNGDFARSFRSGDFARSFRNGELEVELIVETTQIQPIIAVYADPNGNPADWNPIGCYTAPGIGDLIVPIILNDDTNYVFIVAGNNNTTGDFTFLIAADSIPTVTELPFSDIGTIINPITIPNACETILNSPQGDFARSFRNGDFARSFRSGDFARSFRNGELEVELIVETTQIQSIIAIYEDPTGDPADWVLIGCYTAPTVGNFTVPITLEEDNNYIFIIGGNGGTTGGFNFLIEIDSSLLPITELPFADDGTLDTPVIEPNVCESILTNPQGDFARSFRNGDFARSFRSGDFARSFRNGELEVELIVEAAQIQPIIVVYEDPTGDPADWVPIGCYISPTLGNFSVPVTLQQGTNYIFVVAGNGGTVGNFTFLIAADIIPDVTELPFTEGGTIINPITETNICNNILTNPQGDFARSFRNGDFARSFRSGDFARSFRNGELDVQLIVETSQIQPIIAVYEDPTDNPADWILIGCYTAPTVGNFNVPLTLQEGTNYVFIVAGNDNTVGNFNFLLEIDHVLPVTELPFANDGTLVDPIALNNVCDNILTNPQGDFARSFRNGDFARSFRSGDFARSFRNGELEAELIVETSQIQPIIAVYQNPNGNPINWILIGCYTAPTVGNFTVPIVLNEDTNYVFVVAGDNGTTGNFSFLIHVDSSQPEPDSPFDNLIAGTENPTVIEKGVTISITGAPNPAVVFDSDEHPTPCDISKCDSDLRLDQGKVIIVQENRQPAGTQNDRARGGILTYAFDKPIDIESFEIIDNEEGGQYSVDGGLTFIPIPPSNENGSLQFISVNASNVESLIIELDGSGAIDDLTFEPSVGILSVSSEETVVVENQVEALTEPTPDNDEPDEPVVAPVVEDDVTPIEAVSGTESESSEEAVETSVTPVETGTQDESADPVDPVENEPTPMPPTDEVTAVPTVVAPTSTPMPTVTTMPTTMPTETVAPPTEPPPVEAEPSESTEDEPDTQP